MAIHTFIACDTCNHQGIRLIETRRGGHRNQRQGRRISDGRSWFEGTEEDAREYGWHTTPDGQHVCPLCYERGLQNMLREVS